MKLKSENLLSVGLLIFFVTIATVIIWLGVKTENLKLQNEQAIMSIKNEINEIKNMLLPGHGPTVWMYDGYSYRTPSEDPIFYHVNVVFSQNPIFACPKTKNVVIVGFTMSSPLTADIVASSISCIALGALSFSFEQDIFGDRKVKMPNGFSDCELNRTPKARTLCSYSWDGDLGILLNRVSDVQEHL